MKKTEIGPYCKDCKWFKGNGKPCTKSGHELVFDNEWCKSWKEKQNGLLDGKRHLCV